MIVVILFSVYIAMDNAHVNSLVENLKDPDEDIRSQATEDLWQIWFEQKGEIGLQILQRAQVLLQAGESNQAETVLTQLIQDMPDFAEAWNRRAVLYFIRKQYRKAIADCQTTLQHNPIHFGALHGLGLSYASLGEYSNAIHAFRQALAIQPYSVENQRLILECTARLS
jgi:tetratricopeptide (TPR) repeat protein